MNKITNFFIILGLFLIITSISLLIHNNYQDIKAGKESKDILDIMKNNQKETNYINDEIIIKNEFKEEMETTNINGYDYIGTITISKLNLELPINSEYDYDRLNIAPCRYYGSIHTNDLIICAHSYKNHFKYLDNLKPKDKVIFTDIKGNTYIYEVLEIEVLNPNEVSEMINNEFDLTLYTCTDDGLNRITIRCNQITNSI